MKEKINIIEISNVYCKEHSIPQYDSFIIINEVKSIIEDYFNKQIYITKSAVRFLETDKKITISDRLIKNIKQELSYFIKKYIENNSKINNNYKLQYSVQICTVYKKTQHGCYVSFLDKYGFVDKNAVAELKLGEKYYLFIEKYNNKKKIYKVIQNHHKVGQVILDRMFKLDCRFKVNKYKSNTLLSFLYQGDRPNKDDITRIRLYFKKEKIIYNKKEN
jgi:hypothetical protein